VFQLCDSDALALFTTLMNTWLVTVLIGSFRKTDGPKVSTKCQPCLA